MPINSPVPTLTGPAIDFEGFVEGTLIDTQFAGVTFGQDDGGRPQIDNSPFLFGYIQSSGEAVLTGSTEGGAPTEYGDTGFRYPSAEPHIRLNVRLGSFADSTVTVSMRPLLGLKRT